MVPPKGYLTTSATRRAMKHPLAVLLLSCILWPLALAGAPVRDRHVEAGLVAESTGFVPGRTAYVAVRLVHDEHWHTYWQNPGEAGLATTVKWTLPAGFRAGPVLWPAPALTDTGGVLTYGYDGEVLLIVRIEVPANAQVGTTAILAAQVEWLMCKESCVPGRAELTLALPVVARAAPDPQWGAKIATARVRLPGASDELKVRAFRTGKVLQIVAEPDGPVNPALRQVYYRLRMP